MFDSWQSIAGHFVRGLDYVLDAVGKAADIVGKTADAAAKVADAAAKQGDIAAKHAADGLKFAGDSVPDGSSNGASAAGEKAKKLEQARKRYEEFRKIMRVMFGNSIKTKIEIMLPAYGLLWALPKDYFESPVGLVAFGALGVHMGIEAAEQILEKIRDARLVPSHAKAKKNDCDKPGDTVFFEKNIVSAYGNVETSAPAIACAAFGWIYAPIPYNCGEKIIVSRPVFGDFRFAASPSSPAIENGNYYSLMAVTPVKEITINIPTTEEILKITHYASPASAKAKVKKGDCNKLADVTDAEEKIIKDAKRKDRTMTAEITGAILGSIYDLPGDEEGEIMVLFGAVMLSSYGLLDWLVRLDYAGKKLEAWEPSGKFFDKLLEKTDLPGHAGRFLQSSAHLSFAVLPWVGTMAKPATVGRVGWHVAEGAGYMPHHSLDHHPFAERLLTWGGYGLVASAGLYVTAKFAEYTVLAPLDHAVRNSHTIQSWRRSAYEMAIGLRMNIIADNDITQFDRRVRLMPHIHTLAAG